MANKKAKEIRAWAVFFPGPDQLFDRVAYSRRGAIEKSTVGGIAWRELYRLGYRVRRVRVIVEE